MRLCYPSLPVRPTPVVCIGGFTSGQPTWSGIGTHETGIRDDPDSLPVVFGFWPFSITTCGLLAENETEPEHVFTGNEMRYSKADATHSKEGTVEKERSENRVPESECSAGPWHWLILFH